MSLFNLPLGSVTEIATKITGSTAVAIVGGTDDAWYVPWMAVGNTADTPSLTVDLYDGTTAYYQSGEGGSLWLAKAVTTKQAVFFRDIYVPANWTLRVTSSDAAGKFDVTGVAAVVTKIS